MNERSNRRPPRTTRPSRVARSSAAPRPLSNDAMPTVVIPEGTAPGAAPALPVFDPAKQKHLLDEGEIGVGGSSSVRRVYDPVLRRRLAMKILRSRSNSDGDAQALHSFVQEAEITAQLEHPNIIPVHELVVGPAGSSYFTMRLVRGHTLSHLIRHSANGLTDSEDLVHILNVFLRVCDAVAFAHSRGVVHGDIKPENIMVGSFGEVYLMDWGIAGLTATGVRDSEQMVSTSAKRRIPLGIRGTPGYISPEQAQGHPASIDERTDVFGLGAVLYFILTGQPPFFSATTKESLAKARACRFEDPERTARGKSLPALSAITRKAMEFESSQRYASVLDLQRDVRLFLHGGSHFPSRTIPAGSPIVREGDPGDEAFIIVSGSCLVSKIVDGRRHDIRRLGPGGVFGETAIFSANARTATVEAVDEVTVRIVTRALIQEQLGLHPWLGQFVLALAERFREVDDKLPR